MKISMMLAAVVLVGSALAGCNVPTPGTTRHLGAIEYGSAFATAREVMAEHFSIASADADSGVIEARPKDVEATGERLLGGRSPARHMAKMQVRRKGDGVVAHASIAVQREGSDVYRSSRESSENYDEVPNRTPAEAAAATTPEQNEAWQTERYDHALERDILEQIYRALHPREPAEKE